MKPDLRQRRVVEVKAARTWGPALEHRVYSCPDTPEYADVWGANCLILKNRHTQVRVPLEVSAVVTLPPDDPGQLDALEERFRTRLRSYRAAVEDIPGILQPGVAHRFYFLSGEPWPEWLQGLTASASQTEWTAILSVCTDPGHFFEWPRTSMLLWPGCTRLDDHPYEYPPELKARLEGLGLKPDVRPGNGPAITAFLAAGGRRPIWGNEGWPIHHIYDGTGAVPGGPQEEDIPHAVHDGRYFTHSAGLVAAHPVAHDLAHRSDLLKWLLRREAFLRFGFDPQGFFSQP